MPPVPLRAALALLGVLFLPIASADLVAVTPEGDAEAQHVAVSGTGNARGSYAVSGTGDATGHHSAPWACFPYDTCRTGVSGTGAARGQHAASVTGDASGANALSLTGNASGGLPLTVAGRCNGRACLAVGFGEPTTAENLAIGVGGPAQAQRLAIAIGSSADTGWGGLAVGTLHENPEGHRCIVSAGSGNAYCATPDPTLQFLASGPVVVHPADDAESPWIAASGTGDARGRYAASGTGRAEGHTAASVTGDSVSTVPHDSECAFPETCPIAVTATGNATGRSAHSVAGHASGRSTTSVLGACNGRACFLVNLDDDAHAEQVGVSGDGDASGRLLAASVFGRSDSPGHSISGFGTNGPCSGTSCWQVNGSGRGGPSQNCTVFAEPIGGLRHCIRP